MNLTVPTKRASKLKLLVRRLPSDPAEFFDRVTAFASARADRWRGKPDTSECWSISKLRHVFETAHSAALAHAEEEMCEVEGRVEARLRALRENAPFQFFHNGDRNLAALCFLACRATNAEVVVETGTAYGVTAAFTLHALSLNNNGHLWSVDLPPLAANGDSFVGSAIPDDLRGRWTLIRGTSRRALPPLLSQVRRVDVFVHDSLHTYRNMMREFQAIWPLMPPGGVLIADDVEGNRAFLDFAGHVVPEFCAMIREETKKSVCGILIKRR